MLRDLQRLGPLDAANAHCATWCPACRRRFQPGDFYTLIVLGPGGDFEQRELAVSELPFKAVAVAIHWSCATGELDGEPGAKADSR